MGMGRVEGKPRNVSDADRILLPSSPSPQQETKNDVQLATKLSHFVGGGYVRSDGLTRQVTFTYKQVINGFGLALRLPRHVSIMTVAVLLAKNTGLEGRGTRDKLVIALGISAH
jgi:hypothetical protein